VIRAKKLPIKLNIASGIPSDQRSLPPSLVVSVTSSSSLAARFSTWAVPQVLPAPTFLIWLDLRVLSTLSNSLRESAVT
jgi:hypothetical protein